MEQTILQKWEYHVEEFSSVNTMSDTLTELGEDGWELVNVIGGNSLDASGPTKSLRRKQEAYRAFLKRPAD